MSVNEKMTAIADRLRGYSQKADLLSLNDMPIEVDSVFMQGLDYGRNFDTYFSQDTFWDVFQCGGKRTDYSYAFSGYEFGDDELKPKYPLNIKKAYRMFKGNLSITDLSGVSMDFSECDDFYEAFFGCTALLEIGDIFCVNAQDLEGAFASCSALTKIGTLTVTKDVAFTTTFFFCRALTSVDFEGEIGHDLSMKSCPLDRASIESIICCLSDETSGKTLTLKSGQVDSAFETSEGAGDGAAVFEALISGKTNWSFSY